MFDKSNASTVSSMEHLYAVKHVLLRVNEAFVITSVLCGCIYNQVTTKLAFHSNESSKEKLSII